MVKEIVVWCFFFIGVEFFLSVLGFRWVSGIVIQFEDRIKET